VTAPAQRQTTTRPAPGAASTSPETRIRDAYAALRDATPGFTTRRAQSQMIGVVARALGETPPDALHIATEGPLGWAARRHALARGWRFTTSYHTRFPEYLAERMRIPAALTYAVLRYFHKPSQRILVPTQAMADELAAAGFARLQVWARGVDGERFHYLDEGKGPPLVMIHGLMGSSRNLTYALSGSCASISGSSRSTGLARAIRPGIPARRRTCRPRPGKSRLLSRRWAWIDRWCWGIPSVARWPWRWPSTIPTRSPG